MVIRREDIKTLSDENHKKIVEALLRLLQVEEFKTLELYKMSSNAIEYVYIEYGQIKVTVAYPSIVNNPDYEDIKYEYIKYNTKNFSCVIKEGKIRIKAYGIWGDVIKLTTEDPFSMIKKIPDFLTGLRRRKNFHGIRLIPYIEKKLEINLAEVDEFYMDKLLHVKAGKIIAVGEKNEEFWAWNTHDEFIYNDKNYKVRYAKKLLEKDIEIKIVGIYEELKSVSIKDIMNKAWKRKKSLQKAADKLNN